MVKRIRIYLRCDETKRDIRMRMCFYKADDLYSIRITFTSTGKYKLRDEYFVNLEQLPVFESMRKCLTKQLLNVIDEDSYITNEAIINERFLNDVFEKIFKIKGL